MIIRSCLPWRPANLPPSSSLPRLSTARHFHTRPPLRDDNESFPNHYDTLELPLHASPTEIKKQFYALSKSHHPDLHPNDPTAAARFVRLSTAYAVLGSADAKARYDRDLARALGPRSHQQTGAGAHRPARGGSFSSAATAASPAGGRPASGLSRRRTQFRGPPPSFYASGGWGAQEEKRRRAAAAGAAEERSSHEGERAGREDGATATAAGMGPGGFAQGWDNDVPHFDQRGHYQTHSQIERTRHRARRRSMGGGSERVCEETGGAEMVGGAGAAFNFLMVSSVLGVVVTLGFVVGGIAAGADPRKPGRTKTEERRRDETKV